jgi:hypothetical protein
VFGHECLDALAEQHKAKGDGWLAAKLFISASLTDGVTQDSHTSQASNGTPPEVVFLKKACDVLETCEETVQTRSFEIIARGRASMKLMWDNPWNQASFARINYLAGKGVDMKSPLMLVGVGCAQVAGANMTVGLNTSSSAIAQLPEAHVAAFSGYSSPCFQQAFDAMDDDDPAKHIAGWFSCVPPMSQFYNSEVSRKHMDVHAPLTKLKWMIETYEYEVHHPVWLKKCPWGMDMELAGSLASRALHRYGDIKTAKTWHGKLCAIWEGMDIRADPGHYNAVANAAVPHVHSFMQLAGLDCLRLMKAVHYTFAEADATAETLHQVNQYYGYENETHSFCSPAFYSSMAKRRHWLLASHEIDKCAFLEWLPPAEWGSAGHGTALIDNTWLSPGLPCSGDGAEVFESLGRFEEGIVAAQRDLSLSAVNPFLRIQSHLAIGRCHAKLGRAQPAEEALQAAIAEAKHCELPFLEMLAHRDLIVHVLDAAGRREEQLAALGGAISRMVLPAGEYTPLLGSGLDAEAAVAAAASAAKPETAALGS